MRESLCQKTKEVWESEGMLRMPSKLRQVVITKARGDKVKSERRSVLPVLLAPPKLGKGRAT